MAQGFGLLDPPPKRHASDVEILLLHQGLILHFKPETGHRFQLTEISSFTIISDDLENIALRCLVYERPVVKRFVFKTNRQNFCCHPRLSQHERLTSHWCHFSQISGSQLRKARSCACTCVEAFGLFFSQAMNALILPSTTTLHNAKCMFTHSHFKHFSCRSTKDPSLGSPAETIT